MTNETTGKSSSSPSKFNSSSTLSFVATNPDITMSDKLLLFFLCCLTLPLGLVGPPIVKIFHLPRNKASPELLYDSAKRNIKDRNVTIPLNTSSSSSFDKSSSEFVYKKFRYYFECRSISGPIEWVYNGLGAPHVHVQNARHTLDPKNSVLSPAAGPFKYTSTIWFYTGNDREESATGQYTCRSVQRHMDNTTVYVFISGRREFMLDALLTTRGLRLRSLEIENVAVVVHRDLTSTKCRIFNVHMQFDGSDHNNELSNDDFWMTFPCSVSKPVFHLRPKAHVILYKVNITSAEWTFLPLNSSNLTFDPRSGFRVHSSYFFNSWNSSYFICASNNVKTLINITLSMRTSPKSNHNTTALGANTNIVKVNFNHRSQEFLCSYYTSWINNFEAVPCYSMIQCQFAEAGLKNYLQAQSMLSRASDSDIDVDVDVDVNAFDHHNDPKSLSGGGPTIKTLKTKPVDYEFMDSGFVYCWNRIKFDAMRFYKLRNGSLNIISTTDRLPMDEDILQVGILPANDDDVNDNARVGVLAHNGSITFYCEGSRMFVAQPFVWELSAVENETTTTTYKQGKLDSSGRKIIRSMMTIQSYELRNYTRVECHAPVWNSMDWVHVAIPSDMLTRVARLAAGAKATQSSTAAATWPRIRIEIITLSMQATIVLILISP